MKRCLYFQFRTFQPVLGSIWDLLGDLAISLCMKPCTKHQVCMDHWKYVFSRVVSNLCTLSNVFKDLWVQDLPLSMKSGRTRTFIHPFYVNFSTNHITSLLGCRQLERNFPARTKKLSKIGVSDANIVCTDDSIAQFITTFITISGLSASVKTTDLLFEPVWKSYNKLLVKILIICQMLKVLICEYYHPTELFLLSIVSTKSPDIATQYGNQVSYTVQI